MTIEGKGLNHGAQAVGITDIYGPDKMAKVFLPYALPDDLVASVSGWQVWLHRRLADKQIMNLGMPVPNESDH
jgi:hypothetical protein